MFSSLSFITACSILLVYLKWWFTEADLPFLGAIFPALHIHFKKSDNFLFSQHEGKTVQK
jgi:hypothetical protein